MNIEITKIQGRGHWLDIHFAHSLWADRNHIGEFTNDIGTRAYRILRLCVGGKGRVSLFGGSPRILSVNYSGEVEEFRTLQTLQAVMDRYCDLLLAVYFEALVVRGAGRRDQSAILRNMDEVRAFQALHPGKEITVEQRLRLTMPAAERDTVRLRNLLPGIYCSWTDHLKSEDPHALNFSFHPAANQSPWNLVAGLAPQIELAIV